MKEIKASDYQTEVLESKVPVLLDLYTPSCGPCRKMMPVLEKLSEELGDRAKVVKINVEESLELAAKLGVRGVPTFKVYHNGHDSWTGIGIQASEKLKTVLLGE